MVENAHMQTREKKGGVSASVKRCPACDTIKSSDEFWISRSARDGLQGRCKECQRAHKRGPGRYDSGLASWKYGLAKLGVTPEEYDAMFTTQGGVCALCFKEDPRRRLSVDHCHDTGRIRGLLCHPCNVALGLLKDDPVVIERILGYLAA